MTLRFVIAWTILAASVAYGVGFFAGAAAEHQTIKTNAYRCSDGRRLEWVRP